MTCPTVSQQVFHVVVEVRPLLHLDKHLAVISELSSSTGSVGGRMERLHGKFAVRASSRFKKCRR